MPTYDFICEVCEKLGRDWREEGKPPRFCSRTCKNIGMAGQSFKPVKWVITPQIHAMIEKIYKRDTGNGQVAALAKRIGYPRWKITRHARVQGWIAKQKKEPDWSWKEITILEQHAQYSPERIQIKLKAAGFSRSVTGIVLKRKRLRLPSKLEGYSARALALCLGVDDHFVTKAIKAGRLKAKMRHTHRTEQQGGDIYFIKDGAVRDYIINHLNEIDIRKVDKYWFVNILVGRNSNGR